MAKKKAGKKLQAKTAKARGKKKLKYEKPAITKLVSHRITTHKGQASTSVEVAPEPTRGDRQPIILPEPEDAVKVLKVLAELNDWATEAHERYLDLKERTKTAKESWEGLAEEVQRKLRLATHGSDLPLFDAAEREADHQQMLQAAVEPPEKAGEDAPGATNGQGGVPTPTPDQIPF